MKYMIHANRRISIQGTVVDADTLIGIFETEFPIDNLLSMLRIQNARAVPVAVEEDEPVEPESNSDPDSPFKWRDIAVADLVLDDEAREPLVDAGLLTVGAIVDHADEHKGLTGVQGIGKAREKDIVNAIRRVMPV